MHDEYGAGRPIKHRLYVIVSHSSLANRYIYIPTLIICTIRFILYTCIGIQIVCERCELQLTSKIERLLHQPSARHSVILQTFSMKWSEYINFNYTTKLIIFFWLILCAVCIDTTLEGKVSFWFMHENIDSITWNQFYRVAFGI